MKRRGQVEVLELTTLFDIIIGLMIATFLIIAATSWNSVSNFNKVYLEEELKLLSNSVLSSPASVKVTYPLSTNYKIEMKEEIKVVHTPKMTGEESRLVMEASSSSDQLRVERIG